MLLKVKQQSRAIKRLQGKINDEDDDESDEGDRLSFNENDDKVNFFSLNKSGSKYSFQLVFKKIIIIFEGKKRIRSSCWENSPSGS